MKIDLDILCCTSLRLAAHCNHEALSHIVTSAHLLRHLGAMEVTDIDESVLPQTAEQAALSAELQSDLINIRQNATIVGRLSDPIEDRVRSSCLLASHCAHAIYAGAPLMLMKTLLSIVVCAFPAQSEVNVWQGMGDQIGRYIELLVNLEDAIEHISFMIAQDTSRLVDIAVSPLRLLMSKCTKTALPDGDLVHCAASLALRRLGISLRRLHLNGLVDLASTFPNDFLQAPCIEGLRKVLKDCSLLKSPAEEIFDFQPGMMNFWVCVALPLQVLQRFVSNPSFEVDLMDVFGYGQLNLSFTVFGALSKLCHWYRQGRAVQNWTQSIGLLIFHPTIGQVIPIYKDPLTGKSGLLSYRNQSFVPGSMLLTTISNGNWALTEWQKNHCFSH